MRKYNLSFISDHDLVNHVTDTVEKYSFDIDLKKFNSQIIDPVKLTFDSVIYDRTVLETIENEAFRQLDKSNSNLIGYFHQNIFKYIGNSWQVPDEGFDIINEQLGIFVEMKNKHNTMNSTAAKGTFIRFQQKLLENHRSTCYLVEVIAKTSQDIPWVITINKKKQTPNQRLRRISIDKFYELVTGERDAFKNLCEILPRVLYDVVNSKVQRDVNNTVYSELNEYSNNILKSLFLMAFNSYNGFNRFNIDVYEQRRYIQE
jgi:hypothetical protein